MAGGLCKKILAVVFGASIAYWFLDDFDPACLKGKRVLVTGASTGIGEQLAYRYATFGASVVVSARRKQLLKKVVARCRELGSADQVFDYVQADLGNLSTVDGVIEEAVRKMDGLDILVLNHILPHPLAPWSGSHDNLTLLQQLLDVNLRSYIHLASAAMPHLRQSSGSIIVMSSLAGVFGMPYITAYSATKFALFGFFSSLRSESEMEEVHPTVSITLTTIGLVGTENAIHYLRRFGSTFLLNNFHVAPPSEAALAVVRGGALRHRDVFYPYLATKPIVLLRDWCPGLVNALVKFFNARNTDTPG